MIYHNLSLNYTLKIHLWMYEFKPKLTCYTCAGTGSITKHVTEWVTCRACNGVGQIRYPKIGAQNNFPTPCFSCSGSGKVSRPKVETRTCQKCKRDSYEIVISEIDEIGFGDKIDTKLECPNFKLGTIYLEAVGLWD